MVPLIPPTRLPGSLAACLAYILELDPDVIPPPAADEDPAEGWTVSRWLGGLGMGIARVAQPASFAWPGPWIARVHAPDAEHRYAVMFGVPSGVGWDPGRPARRHPGNR